MLERDALVNVIKVVLRAMNVVPLQRRSDCLLQVLNSLVGMSEGVVCLYTAYTLKLMFETPKYTGAISRNTYIPPDILRLSIRTIEESRLFISKVEQVLRSSLSYFYGNEINQQWIQAISLLQIRTSNKRPAPTSTPSYTTDYPAEPIPSNPVNPHSELECCHPKFRKLTTTSPLPDNLQFTTQCSCINCFIRNCYPCHEITQYLGAYALEEASMHFCFMLSADQLNQIASGSLSCNMYVLSRTENQWKLDERRYRISMNGVDIFGNMSIMVKNQYNLRRLLRAGRNTVFVPYFPPSMYIAFHLTKEHTIEQFVSQFKNEATHSLEQSKADFLKLLTDEEDMGVDSSFPFSLLDPLSKLRLTVPVRSTSCDHLPCFDLPNFLEIYMNKEKKPCPVCNQPILIANIKLDRYVLHMLESTNEDQDEVNVKPSGEWELCEQKEEHSEEEEEEEAEEEEEEEEEVEKEEEPYQNYDTAQLLSTLFNSSMIDDLWRRTTFRSELNSMISQMQGSRAPVRPPPPITREDGIIDLVSDSDSSQEPQAFPRRSFPNVEIIDILD